MQNQATWIPQFWNIAGYYACLLPFFFLTGVFVSLSFVLNAEGIGTVYGYDLTGAGVGARLVLGLMFVVHPFMLVPLPAAAAGRQHVFHAGPPAPASVAGAFAALLRPRRCWCWTARRIQRLQGDLRPAPHA